MACFGGIVGEVAWLSRVGSAGWRGFLREDDFVVAFAICASSISPSSTSNFPDAIDDFLGVAMALKVVIRISLTSVCYRLHSLGVSDWVELWSLRIQ